MWYRDPNGKKGDFMDQVWNSFVEVLKAAALLGAATGGVALVGFVTLKFKSFKMDKFEEFVIHTIRYVEAVAPSLAIKGKDKLELAVSRLVDYANKLKLNVDREYIITLIESFLDGMRSGDNDTGE